MMNPDNKCQFRIFKLNETAIPLSEEELKEWEPSPEEIQKEIDSCFEFKYFNEEDQKIFGGVCGMIVYMNDFDETIEKEKANTSILCIYDENNKIVQTIYGEINK